MVECPREEKNSAAMKIKNVIHFAPVIIALTAVIGLLYSSCYQFPTTIKNSDRQFELINRPFVEITAPVISIGGKALGRGGGIIPEIQFNIVIGFVNHGKLPAYIKQVDCIFESTDESEVCIAMPYPIDKERQWGNFDIFPYINEKDTRVMSINPFINILDMRRVMRLDENFANNIASSSSKFWLQNDQDIRKEIIQQMKMFFLIIQIEYYKLGDRGQKAKTYYYSLKLKVNEGIGGASFFKSISGETEKNGKWFKVFDDGSIKIL